jgi:adenylate cyclase
MQTAALLKGKVVVFQMAAPNESTDLIVTAMTTAALGPKLMTPGAQYIVDAVETILNQDEPRPPANGIKFLLFSCVAVISVIAGAFFQQIFLPFLFAMLVSILGALCYLNPIVQLWPVMATASVFGVGTSQMVIFHLLIGLKEGELVKRYISEPVHKLLLALKIHESFKSRRCHVAILMSDLAGYTTVTGLLKDPELVLELMNDYLEETSLVLQEKHDGILESYLGDMVCYYWIEDGVNGRVEMYRKALLGAIELRKLQKQFFATLLQRYQHKVDVKLLQRINEVIDAGIGVTVGDVVMGDLGPQHGIKKFGILGDRLNLVSRIEGLTRLFNADIIIAGDFLGVVEVAGLVTRRLGRIKVKGRLFPEALYALGCPEDLCFEKSNVEQWTQWLADMELGIDSKHVCPECYQKDKNTISTWMRCGLLGEDGVWYLDEK